MRVLVIICLLIKLFIYFSPLHHVHLKSVFFAGSLYCVVPYLKNILLLIMLSDQSKSAKVPTIEHVQSSFGRQRWAFTEVD